MRGLLCDGGLGGSRHLSLDTRAKADSAPEGAISGYLQLELSVGSLSRRDCIARWLAERARVVVNVVAGRIDGEYPAGDPAKAVA